MDHNDKNHKKLSVSYVILDDKEYFYNQDSKLLYSVHKPHNIVGKYDNYKIKFIK